MADKLIILAPTNNLTYDLFSAEKYDNIPWFCAEFPDDYEKLCNLHYDGTFDIYFHDRENEEAWNKNIAFKIEAIRLGRERDEYELLHVNRSNKFHLLCGHGGVVP